MNGFFPASPRGAGSARYAEPVTSSSIDGVLILTVASFELFGHPWPSFLFLRRFFRRQFFGVLRLAARLTDPPRRTG